MRLRILRYLSAGAPGAPEGHSPLPLALHMWHCCVLAGPARARRPDGRLSPLAWLSHGTVSALGTAAMPAAGSRGKPGADGRVKERPMDPDGHRRWSPPAARKAVSLRTRRRLLRIMSIVFGISVCAMFVGAASRVAGFLAGVSRVLRLEQDTRYSQYISEPQAPLSVPLDAVPWKEVSSASGAPADAWIAYNGFSHLICPGLLAAVVVPSVAHCRALCAANSPPCEAFTFTPAGRCYLHTPVESSTNGIDHAFRGWPAEDVPAVVSGTVAVPAGRHPHGASASLFSRSQARVPTKLCDNYETMPRLRKLDAADFAATLGADTSKGQRGADTPNAYLPHSPEGRLFEKARARLEQAATRRNGHSQTQPQHRLLLSVGIDCCQRSKVLHSLTGLAFAGFDAVVQPGREHYGHEFATTYDELVHEWRGAGYWVWKPYFLLRTLLELAQDDDLVFYGDAGTYFHTDTSMHRQMEWDFLYNHSRTAQGLRQDVLVYAEGSPEWQRTKSDLTNAALVGLSADGAEREAILRSSQLSATWVIVRRSPQSIAFVNDWLSACLGASGILMLYPIPIKTISHARSYA